MNVWTDYPSPGKEGVSCEMRQVKLVAYNHDKYVTTDSGESFKAGYCYRSKRKRPIRHTTLCRNLPIESEPCETVTGSGCEN